MSSIDAGPCTLEYFLEESTKADLDVHLMDKLVEVMEPYRITIELRLEDYDEERHGSWRDYRNALWLGVHPDHEKKVEDIINRHVESRKTQFLLRTLKEAVGKSAQEAAKIMEVACREEIGATAALKANSHLRVIASQRYGVSTGELPKRKLPAILKWIEAKEKALRAERYSVLLDIIDHGKLVHIDDIYDGLFSSTPDGRLEEQEAEMLELIHNAMDDGVLFANGDEYGRMYWACMQADEDTAHLECSCALHRLSDGAIVFQMCEAHLKVSERVKFS